MDSLIVKNALVTVLEEVQAATSHTCPPLKDSLKPAYDLPEFNSKIWLTAICMISEKLNVDIPNDVNLFVKDGTCEALTIEEIVNKIIEIVEPSVNIRKRRAAK